MHKVHFIQISKMHHWQDSSLYGIGKSLLDSKKKKKKKKPKKENDLLKFLKFIDMLHFFPKFPSVEEEKEKTPNSISTRTTLIIIARETQQIRTQIIKFEEEMKYLMSLTTYFNKLRIMISTFQLKLLNQLNCPRFSTKTVEDD